MPLTRSALLNSSSLTPISLLNSEETSDDSSDSPRQVTLAIEYTQIAFPFLMEKWDSGLREAIITKPRSIRTEHLLAALPVDTELGAEEAWPVARELLDVLEAEMRDVLETHSVFFWLHLYRRIGVMLSPGHEDKTDERTVALVRQVVELAIAKHGQAKEAWEFEPSDGIDREEILGGYYSEAVSSVRSSNVRHICELLEDGLKKRRALIVRDFSEDDFLGLHYVEGLAYQYWLVTALMRALGKGGRVKLDAEGEWEWVSPESWAFLIWSIDQRTNRSPFQNTLVGVWFDNECSDSRAASASTLICPIYNTERKSIPELLKALGVNIVDDSPPLNFLPAALDLKAYVDAHQFLSQSFSNALGFTLEALASTLWGTANALMAPEEMVREEDEDKRKQVYSANMLNLLQRGYKTVRIEKTGFANEIALRMRVADWPFKVPSDDLETVFNRLTLTPQVQAKIGLWSAGPRFLYMPGALDHVVVDLQGVPALLETLFFRVSHDQAARGSVFEVAFREALTSRGYDVKYGDLVALDGTSRDLDAGVRLGSTFFVLECVSVERPLDYEIGKPQTFAVRQERLEKKVSQASSLVEFLERNRQGKNYDFREIERFEWFVVSPFVEWIWDVSDRLWYSHSIPRILSARESIEVLEAATR
jgi:hypothetical protein